MRWAVKMCLQKLQAMRKAHLFNRHTHIRVSMRSQRRVDSQLLSPTLFAQMLLEEVERALASFSGANGIEGSTLVEVKSMT